MTVAIIISSLLILIYIIIELTSTPSKAFYAKGLASFSFILVFGAAVFRLQAMNLYALFILLGLVMGLLGDLNLALRPLRHKQENEDLIIKGMSSFSIGHLFYYVAMMQVFSFHYLAPIMGLLAMGLVIFISKKLHYEMGKTTFYNYGYAFVMFFMVGQALGSALTSTFSPLSSMLLIGFILFGLSDLILSSIYFENKATKLNIFLNLLAYYAAQVFIAASVFLS